MQIAFDNQRRTPANSCAQQRASTLNAWKDNENDCDIKELFVKPFCWRKWRPELIQMYLDCLTPQNCIFTIQSKAFSTIENLKTEPIYGTKFINEKISPELLDSWSASMPKEGEVLAYTPPNIFIPDSPVTPLKTVRKNPNFSSNPEMIEFGDSTVFFKQDDSFD